MKTVLVIFGSLLLIIIILLWLPKPKNEKPPRQITKPIETILKYEIKRRLRYSFILKNTSNRLIKTANFWAFAPVKQTSIQKVKQITSSQTYELLTDKLGNQTLHFVLTNIPPYSSQVINITVELMLAKTPVPIAETHKSWFLDDETLIQISDSSIQATAKKLLKTTRFETIRNIFHWVAKHIKYAGYIPENLGAVYALHNKRGDCTEYMSLFIALARVNGIPARGIGGYIANDDAFLKPENYHNWAEFYLDNQWLLADPQKQVFLDKQSNYIAMRIISAKSDFKADFWTENKNLIITMKNH